MTLARRSFIFIIAIISMAFVSIANADNNQHSSNANQAPFHVSQYFRSRFYTGLMVGYTGNPTNYINTQTNNNYGYSVSHGFLAGLVAGLQFHFNRVYLGTELFGFLNTAQELNQNIAMNVINRASAQSGVGVHILPGFFIDSNKVVFAVVGLERDHFGLKVNDHVESRGVTGIDLGLGGRISVTDNVAVRVEAEHVFFNSIPVIGGLFNRIRPDSNRIELIITITPKIIRDA